MLIETSEPMSYRFKTLGASGTISFGTDYVHTLTLTCAGYWKQTIPLSDLRPRYGELRTTPDGFVKSWVVAALLVIVGIYGLIESDWPPFAFSLSLGSVVGGCCIAWQLVRNGTTDWIIFSSEGGYNLSYARQGPDAEKCEEFTNALVSAIANASDNSKQNHALDRSDA